MEINTDPKNGDSSRFPVSAEVSKKGVPRGRFRFTTIEKGRRRPTPEPEQVEQILDKLLEREDSERAHCFWLTARLMYGAGMRVQGVAAMTLSALSTALKAEGIHNNGSAYNLAAAASDPSIQRRILEGLEGLARRRRKKLFVLVVEKRRKARDVGIPIDLFEQLLFYIWSMRTKMSAGPGSSDALFLSRKSDRGLSKKSIGAIVSKAFTSLQIPGSAHRLRAAFAESVVRDCYLRARAAHGGGWDRDAVLLEAAEALGHASTRSLGYYLNRIVRELNLVEGEPVIVTSPPEVAIIKTLVEAINAGDANVAAKLRDVAAQIRS